MGNHNKIYSNKSPFISVLVFCPLAVFALTPPGPDDTLCYVEGKVLSHQKEEAADMMMNAIEVDTVTLIIHTTSPVDEHYEGTFCERMAGAGQQAEQKINTFRLCDETDARDGEIIKGVVGESLGGGRYCIEQIQILQQ